MFSIKTDENTVYGINGFNGNILKGKQYPDQF